MVVAAAVAAAATTSVFAWSRLCEVKTGIYIKKLS